MKARHWDVYRRYGGHLDPVTETWEVRTTRKGWLVRHTTIRDGHPDDVEVDPAKYPNDLTGLAKFEQAQELARRETA
jgi:hypothetical protein